MGRPAGLPARSLVLPLLAWLLAFATAARDTCNGGTTDVVVVGAGELHACFWGGPAAPPPAAAWQAPAPLLLRRCKV